MYCLGSSRTDHCPMVASKLERDIGIEPTYEAWRAPALTIELIAHLKLWSAVRESNPRPDHGKVMSCHYTNGAYLKSTHGFRAVDTCSWVTEATP